MLPVWERAALGYKGRLWTANARLQPADSNIAAIFEAFNALCLQRDFRDRHARWLKRAMVIASPRRGGVCRHACVDRVIRASSVASFSSCAHMCPNARAKAHVSCAC